MKVWKHTTLALALTAAFPTLAAAQSNEDLLKELKALKDRVTELENKLKAVPDAPADGSPAQWGMTPQQLQDFNRIAVKTEALEDNTEAAGFKGLKINGVIDPTFIYNRAQQTSSFVFLNNFASPTEGFAYDNSYFGQAVLDIQKELEGGTKWRLTIVPHKSAGSNYNFPSIIHEASVSLPLTDLQTRLWAGQIPDWSGYEYYFANQTKLITHNLMFDFLAPSFYTGIGTDITSGKLEWKTFIGNMNAARYINSGDGNGALRDPMASIRLDYSKGEYAGWGGAAQFGRTANTVAGGSSQLFNSELDGYFIRGDMTLQGQINYGTQKRAAFNGGDSRWYGISGLAAYKVTPRMEVVSRLDYIDNSKNGGGNFNVFFETDDTGAAVGPDSRNGFGPGKVFDPEAGTWAVADPNSGANRYALALGMNYALTENSTIKLEYRYDRASKAVFFYQDDGGYRKSNQLLGSSLVVSF